MKKSLLFVSALIGAAAGMVLSAGAAETTVEEVLSKYSEASATMDHALADATFDVDINLDIPDAGANFSITGNGEMPMGFTLDPLMIGEEGTFNINAVGTTAAVNVSLYMITEDDGSIGMYVKTDTDDEPGEWSYQAVDADDASELTSLIKEQAGKLNLADTPLTFTLDDEMTDVNGFSCYVLRSAMTIDDLINLLKYTGEMVGEPISDEDLSDISEIKDYLAGFVMNLEIDVNAETYQAQRAHLDLDGSDWSFVEAILPSAMDMTDEEGNPMDVSLAVNSLYLDIVYDYESEVSINLPDDAAAAKVAGGETIDADDAEGAIGQILNGIGG